MATVFCENINRKIQAEPGANLRDVLLNEGVRVYNWPHNYCPLGRNRQDVVEVVSGSENLSSLTGKEKSRFGPNLENRRLAGQCVIRGDVTIRIRPE
jgi:hypothetical protein